MGNWSYMGAKVQGATHIKNNKPCQDAIRIRKLANKEVIIAAVADGHGSHTCPFSQEGSQTAVEIVEAFFSRIFLETSINQVFTTIDTNKEIWLPKQIENSWKEKIRFIHEEKGRDTPEDSEFPYHLYGTTILGLVVTKTFIFALQLGDGDILTVDSQGQALWLIEPDYIDGNETFSLCMKNCWEHIKTRIIPLDTTREHPTMLLLTTDGYSNSFASQDGFLKAGEDIYQLLKSHGSAYIESNLEGWLTDSSTNGSGDDITLGLIYQVPSL